MAKFLAAAKKKQKVAPKKGEHARDPDFEKACPAVYEFLVETELDGQPRTPSSVSLFSEGGRWKGSLADKDAECSLYVTADTVWGLLEALDAALQGPDPDWRAWKSQGAGRARKK